MSLKTNMEKGYKKELLTRIAYVGGTSLIALGGVAFARGSGRDSVYLMAYGVLLDTLAFCHDRWCNEQYKKTEQNKKYEAKRHDEYAP